MNTHHNSRLVSRFTRPIALAIALLAAAVPTWSASPRTEGERVLDCSSTIAVRKDGSLLVRETIQVNSLGIAIQNGITREFAAQGQQSPPALTVQDVKLDGQPAPFHVEESPFFRRIVIGETDQPLTTGPHTYSLQYETAPVVADAGGRDRLLWSITGSNWNLPIDAVTGTIELPKGVSQDDVSIEGTTGLEGSRGKRYSFDFDTPGAVTFTAAGLSAGEGLTAKVSWPTGFVRHRSWGIPLFVLENTGVVVSFVGAFVLLLYWLVLRFYFGRTATGKRMAVRTTPPNSVSAAGLRCLRHRTSAENKLLTVAIVSLARAGILTVEQAEGDYILRRTEENYQALPSEERDFAKALFGLEESVSLKLNPGRIRTAMHTLNHALARNYAKGFASIWAFAWPPLAVSGLAVLVSLFLEVRTDLKEDFLPAFLLLLVSVVCTGLVYWVWPASIREWKEDPKESQLPGAIGPNRSQMMLAILLLALLIAVLVLLATKTSFLWTLLLAVHTGVNLCFMKIMRVPTARGQRLLDELEAFRFQMRKLAANPALAVENSEQPEAVFEQYMDHALALDLEAHWTRLIQPGPNMNMNSNQPEQEPYRPAWYTGEDFLNFYLRKPPTNRAAEAVASFSAPGGSWSR